ncbi:drug/metabolite transporter (DMT)-like permease [Aminobacter aminovorans]|uniref:Phosphonate utilization associated putative membrane protein n=1 Tax=Aminobacter aminovorans TaxID=83263 RepID=A0A380WL94_AMIAI|nr:DMT family transporter [Aminobacter aminovorans]TCS27948.1 drug/metabolite transporter (DMT)-like permease [Aminobacter aminovorans]SUU89640.1 phosphonate utilization associated putative membrane protein [Aminobacter aminovorans]
MPLSSNIRGATFMVVAMAAFTFNDTLSKLAAQTINPGQLMLVRGLFATTLISLLAWQQGALKGYRNYWHPMVFLRLVGEVGGTVCFLAALPHLPLGNISAVLQALPLAVTMGAALFLGEAVGWRRWLAIASGFGGVLIIVRPGFEGFNAFSLLALLSVAFCAVRDLATRKIPGHIPSLFVSTTTTVIITVTGALTIVPFGGWVPMSVNLVAFLAGAAVLVLFGYQFVIMAMREGEISFIAPFRYTALIWALSLSVFVFGDIPDLAMITGAAVIVASGLYSLYRERVVGKGRPAAESTSASMAPDGI